MFTKIASTTVIAALSSALIVSAMTPAAAMSDGAAAAIGVGAFAAGVIVASNSQHHSSQGGYGGGNGGYASNYRGGYVQGAGPARRLKDWEVPAAGSGRTVMAPASVAASGTWTGCRPYTDRFGQPFQRCCSINAGVRTCYGHW